MKFVTRIFGIAAALSAVSCAVGPNYRAPATTMPAAFSANIPTTRPATVPTDLTQWWKSLNDPRLDSLIERAIQNNPDLEIALTRVQESREIESALTGVALPQAGLSGAAARGSGTNSTKSRISGPLNAASNTTGYREITDIVGFDAGWELDVFGSYRREIEAAKADSQAALEERNAALVVLISDVARAYIDDQALELRLKLIRDDIQ